MSDDTEILDEFDKNSNLRPQKLIKETRVKAESEINSKIAAETLKLEKKQKSLLAVYKAEEKVPVTVAPSYAKYFGRVMHVSINGISIGVRCDGNTVRLPESFATEVMRRMKEMDKYELRLQKMAKVTTNFETSPGQLNFFG